MMVSVLASVPLTNKQEDALKASAEHGGAIYGPPDLTMDPEFHDMCKGLARAGMMGAAPPYAITGVGKQVLAAHSDARHVAAYLQSKAWTLAGVAAISEADTISQPVQWQRRTSATQTRIDVLQSIKEVY